MSSLTRIVIESREGSQQIAEFLRPLADDRSASLARLSNWFRGFAGGIRTGTIEVCTGAVKATATITLAGGDIADNDTFALLGQTFTAQSAAPGTNEFLITAGDLTTTAAAIAAAINASDNAAVTAAVIATSDGAVVTITALVPGTIGNGLRLTESLTNATRVDFAGGSNGTKTPLVAGAIT